MNMISIYSRKRLYLWSALVTLIGVSLSATGSEEGIQLAESVYDRPSGHTSSTRATMTLLGKNRSTRVRKLAIYNIKPERKERWSLIRFHDPADIKDTGLLTLNHAGDRSDQWIYLPALDRTRLISSKRKGGRFVGSDFTYEDLRSRDPDLDLHTIEGVDSVGKEACTRLKSVPIDTDTSSYSYKISCIHLPTLIPLQVDYYEKGNNKHIKRLLVEKIKKIQKIWTVLSSTMHDLEKESKTILVNDNLKYDVGIPEELFNKQGLSDPQRETPYML